MSAALVAGALMAIASAPLWLPILIFKGMDKLEGKRMKDADKGE